VFHVFIPTRTADSAEVKERSSFLRETRSAIVWLFSTNLMVHNPNPMFAFLRRRRDIIATACFVYRFLCLFFLAGLAGGMAAGADVRNASVSSVGPGLVFTVADFDGDLRPDLAAIQIGRSGVSDTHYQIQIQLSAAGRQTILLVAPAGGLQIAARDVNGDHALDLVVTTAWLSEPVAIFLNDGHGSFSRVDPGEYPGAFREPKTGWGSSTELGPDVVGVPPQSRTVVYWKAARLPHVGPHVTVIPPPQIEHHLNSSLGSHAGRAPPSQA
jgi:hypothetical protein